jgi:hypothetical protein
MYIPSTEPGKEVLINVDEKTRKKRAKGKYPTALEAFQKASQPLP